MVFYTHFSDEESKTQITDTTVRSVWSLFTLCLRLAWCGSHLHCLLSFSHKARSHEAWPASVILPVNRCPPCLFSESTGAWPPTATSVWNCLCFHVNWPKSQSLMFPLNCNFLSDLRYVGLVWKAGCLPGDLFWNGLLCWSPCWLLSTSFPWITGLTPNITNHLWGSCSK